MPRNNIGRGISSAPIMCLVPAIVFPVLVLVLVLVLMMPMLLEVIITMVKLVVTFTRPGLR